MTESPIDVDELARVGDRLVDVATQEMGMGLSDIILQGALRAEMQRAIRADPARAARVFAEVREILAGLHYVDEEPDTAQLDMMDRHGRT